MDKRRLAVRVALSIVLFMGAILGVLLVSAWTWDYWQAWVFTGVMLVPTTVGSFHLLIRDPELLQRRMRSREREKPLRVIKAVMSALYLIGFVTAGIDHRYGWSNVPVALVIAADAVVLGCYVLIFRVFAENRYAAATVEVEPGQQLVSTGPYAIVRHPMYAVAAPMVLITPLALGSYWAVVPFALIAALVILRLRNEERVLLRDLPGYDEYCRKVRWRLLPGVW